MRWRSRWVRYRREGQMGGVMEGGHVGEHKKKG